MKALDVTEWHGWSRVSSTSLHIGRLPGRKSLCLYVVQGAVLGVLAYFANEKRARLALDTIDEIVSP